MHLLRWIINVDSATTPGRSLHKIEKSELCPSPMAEYYNDVAGEVYPIDRVIIFPEGYIEVRLRADTSSENEAGLSSRIQRYLERGWIYADEYGEWKNSYGL